MSTVYIGIGSNLGSREDNCKAAIRHLIDNGIKVLKLSSMIETEPWGVKDQPKFINMAAKVETGLGPEELLRLLKQIEATIGRRQTIHWGPRAIDLDILFYDDLVLKTPDLEIPHPGIADRYFVLSPLAEIAAEIIHPVIKKSIKELLNELSK
jgi:2-amino-4-hydroxy-6-hydroxymethyldihydropteridine diphosphokinase